MLFYVYLAWHLLCLKFSGPVFFICSIHSHSLYLTVLCHGTQSESIRRAFMRSDWKTWTNTCRFTLIPSLSEVSSFATSQKNRLGCGIIIWPPSLIKRSVVVGAIVEKLNHREVTVLSNIFWLKAALFRLWLYCHQSSFVWSSVVVSRFVSSPHRLSTTSQCCTTVVPIFYTFARCPQCPPMSPGSGNAHDHGTRRSMQHVSTQCRYQGLGEYF